MRRYRADPDAAVLRAASLFRATANVLGHALAADVDRPAGQLWNSRAFPGGVAEDGRLASGWEWGFHGLQCLFTGPAGQTLDVHLGYGDEFGVLDPAFFARFVSTTPELASLVPVLGAEYHDWHRAIERLRARGHLVEVTAEDTSGLPPGWRAA